MQRSTHNDWQTVFIAVLVGVLAAVHYGKVAPALPPIRAELAIGLVLGGWMVSVFSATGALIGIAMGSASDRLGARRLSLAGLLTLALGSALGALADSDWTLLASRFLEGLGFIAVAVSAPVLVVRSVSAAARSLALGLWTTYMPLGMGLAMLSLPSLLEHSDWRKVWWALTLATLASAVLLARRVPADPAPTPGLGRNPGLLHHLHLTLRSPGSWLLSLAFSFYTLQWISLMAWLPSFLLEEKGLNAHLTGLLTAVVVLCNIPGNLTVGWLLKRGYSRAQVLWLGALGMGGCALLILDAGFSDGLRMAAVLCFSYFGGLVPGVVLSGAPEVAPGPAQIGTVNGMMVQGAQLGQLLGPPALAAVVTIHQDWGDTRWLMLAAAMGIALVAGLYRASMGRDATVN